MPTDHRAALASIKRFDQLIAYLRDAMGWPIARDSFEDVDDLFYDFTADELGIDPKTVAKELTQDLAWPEDEKNIDAWRERWRGAFTLRHREVIDTSKELSIRLAELARAIRDRIKAALAIETERGPLTKLMKAFKETLV